LLKTDFVRLFLFVIFDVNVEFEESPRIHF
jgi:hypothetical protein